MIPLLAEAAPNAEALTTFAKVVEVAAWLAMGLAGIVVAWKQITGKGDETKIANNPLEVREAATFATKPELNAVETRVNGEIHQLHGRISSVRNEMEGKMKGVEGKIDDNTKLTAQVSGQVGQINQSVQLILTSLTRKP